MNTPGHKTVLILTGPMGSGHIRAALALKETLQQNYPDDRILYVDTTSWMSPVIRWIFLGLYPFLLKHLPTFWRIIHNMNNSHGKGLFTFLFELFDVSIIHYIRNTVKHCNVDLIICTHFYPGYIVNKMKEKKILSIPSVLVITDHNGHRIYARKGHDIIFVPNQESRDQFISWGVPAEKLHISPCPVSLKFGHVFSEEEVEQLREEFHLKSGIRYIMLTMGGWAIGDMCADAKKLLRIHKDFGLLVMTAHNQKLFRKFSLMAMEDDRILPVPMTDQMEKYMAICTFIATKPGGLTTSECIALKKPMLLLDPIAGHEELNLEYLVRKGFAYTPTYDDDADSVVRHMKEHYREYVSNMEKFSPAVIGAAAKIARESMELIPEKGKLTE